MAMAPAAVSATLCCGALSTHALRAQAEAFSGEGALRVRPGVAARGSKLSPSPKAGDDVESGTSPGTHSGGMRAAFADGNGSSDRTEGSAAWRPLQGRAQQVVLLCWMHGAIGYGYFVMQVRATSDGKPEPVFAIFADVISDALPVILISVFAADP